MSCLRIAPRRVTPVRLSRPTSTLFAPQSRPLPHRPFSSNKHSHPDVPADSRRFKVSAEVRHAIATGRPVLALESTIYTHGYPHPENAVLAAELERLVRDRGVVPATIGIIDGVATVGLASDQIERLAATAGDGRTMKISRRDLAYACSMTHDPPLNGGTTVAGTMVLAHRAGIKVFATGGLGGVHRGAESSMDVSADLTELGRTPVAVVCSGCKSFLDIGRTLEVLETNGVGVATFCDSDGHKDNSGRRSKTEFPAFWSRNSGFSSPLVVRTERDAAGMIAAQFELGIRSGIVFANPIPAHAHIPREEIDAIIDQAVCDAVAGGVVGRDNTPFILKRIRELTKNKSVDANGALIRSNVERGAGIAVELAAVMAGSSTGNKTSYHAPAFQRPAPTVVVAGGLAVDHTCNLVDADVRLGTSNPAHIRQSVGGVGHNIARAVQLLTKEADAVMLCTAVASDPAGESAIESVRRSKIRTDGIYTFSTTTDADVRTGQYIAINDPSRNLHLGVADVSILHHPSFDGLGQDRWKYLFSGPVRPEWLVVDANWSGPALFRWIRRARAEDVAVAFEPVSVAKAVVLADALTLFYRQHQQHGRRPVSRPIQVVTPNRDELEVLHSALARLDKPSVEVDWDSPATVAMIGPELATSSIPKMAVDLLAHCQTVVVTLGPAGVFVATHCDCPDGMDPTFDPTPPSSSSSHSVWLRHFPAIKSVRPDEIVSVNGAGDTFLGGLIAASIGRPGRPVTIPEAVDLAQRAAVESLRAPDAVPDRLAGLARRAEALR